MDLWLRREGDSSGPRGVDPQRGTVKGKGARIRCPKCRWQPAKTDIWQCTCGHHWNTFDTRGVCPACHYRWAITQCRSCHGYSAHDDWYEKEPE